MEEYDKRERTGNKWQFRYSRDKICERYEWEGEMNIYFCIVIRRFCFRYAWNKMEWRSDWKFEKSPKIVQNLLHIVFSHIKFPPTKQGVTGFFFNFSVCNLHESYVVPVAYEIVTLSFTLPKLKWWPINPSEQCIDVLDFCFAGLSFRTTKEGLRNAFEKYGNLTEGLDFNTYNVHVCDWTHAKLLCCKATWHRLFV